MTFPDTGVDRPYPNVVGLPAYPFLPQPPFILALRSGAPKFQTKIKGP